ncbi:type II toxin-antitoxin system RelE/ParE family toxin [Salinimicrobium sp. WS361]|uniref:type II toxin-antitoxin system RelE/ParE family toxin n=1 Tax=Salinimicrobium sp. WS361 TaxID=3425123 RepID=UPI003D6FF9CE
MAYKTKIHPIVRHDLEAAKKWYSERKEELGEEFKCEVNKEIDSIGKSPLQYPRKYKELRQSMIRRFPYSIFFLVEEEKNQIIIIGVLHSSRNPEIIRRRQK